MFTLFIHRRPVLTYFILTFAISWGGLLALGGLDDLSADTWQSDPRLPLFGVAMLAGPALSALLLTRIVSGRAGLRELGSRLSQWRVDARWYLVALLTAPVVFSVVDVALSFISTGFRPTILAFHDTTSVLLSGIAAALVVGVLEELGWTGFATPRLRSIYGPIATGLIVGVPWGAWHLLTNDIWIARTYSGELSPATFGMLTALSLLAGQLPAFRVLMVWVYDRTGSLPLAMLMHASLSGSTFILGPEKITGLALVGYGFALTAAWWTVVAVVLAADRRRASRGSTAAASRLAAFTSADGEAAFMAAYGAAMKKWPVAYEEVEALSRFGITHIVVSGPKGAPPLVLLHGYMATSVMWAPNIAALSRDHRVYAIDVMGQPGKSIPGDSISRVADYVAWLTSTLDALRLDRVALLGMSFGGWLALTYAVANPQRVEKLVLLSPGGFLAIRAQFSLRGMLMVFLPTRLTVKSFMRWAGFSDKPGERDASPVLDLMYLGMKHFRLRKDTLRIAAGPLTDAELRSMKVPVLLLMGDREVICDAATALTRARRLVPDLEAEIIPGCRHDMCFSQHLIVDGRVVRFLTDRWRHVPELAAA